MHKFKYLFYHFLNILFISTHFYLNKLILKDYIIS